MAALQKTSRRWSDGFCIVAGSGPSLTPQIAEFCRAHHVVAVNDAYRLLPLAEVLYACDGEWWRVHDGCREFAGERWSSHGNAAHNDKRSTADRFGLNLIRGADLPGFSLDPALLHYGEMGGYQAVNLAGHFLGWIGRIALVGFDLQPVEGRRHFFGDHPAPLRSTVSGPSGAYAKCIRAFELAATLLPPGIQIVNCTQGSALRCFPMMDVADALPVAA